jgi:hypothetical protein
MLDPSLYSVEHLPPFEANKSGPSRRLGLHTAADLMAEDLPPMRFVVPGYLTEGVTLLGGKPKIGKSWLTAGICIAVATGGYALGSIKVDEGDVLWLALEDNKRRLQRRLNQLLPTGNRPKRLYYDLTCPRLDDGGLEAIREWIESVPNPRLVVVDVLNKVRPQQRSNEGIYDYDVRSLAGLQGLAAEFGIAIVVVHHTRKAEAEDPFDCLSGSTGLTGTADATLVLSRDSQGVTLYGRGRDLDEIETAMSFDRTSGAWTALGAASEVRKSDSRQAVVTALRKASQPQSPREIADLTGLSHDNARQILARMVAAGDAEKVGVGRYTAASNAPVTAVTLSQADDYRRLRDGDNDDADP